MVDSEVVKVVEFPSAVNTSTGAKQILAPCLSAGMILWLSGFVQAIVTTITK